MNKKIFYFGMILVLIFIYMISSRYIFPAKDDLAVKLKELELQAGEIFTLNLKLSEITSKKRYNIVGGGQLKLDDSFVLSSEPDIYIIHGTDLKTISDFITGNQFTDNTGLIIIITSLALRRCLLEKDDSIFKEKMDNFQKSGNIFNKDGKRFYYMDQLEFSVKENLSGIILSFPEDRYFSKVKNYGLAHLIQTDFSLEGLQNPVNFLESIHFPKPSGFQGSFNDLVNQAKTEFHEKFFKNIIEMDFSNGLLVPKDLIPLAAPKRTGKILPLFKSIRLSDNVYFSGLKTHN